MKKILLVVFLLLFLMIGFGQAQAAGLVPCEGASCGICDFFKLLSNIFNFAMKLVIIIGTLMLVAGGGYLLFAGANPGMLETGKKIITSTIWGIVIIFAAFMIVGTVLSAVGLADWTQNIYKNWWEKGFWQPSCLTSGPSTVSTTPPSSGETPKVLAPGAPGSELTANVPINSAPQLLNVKVIPDNDVPIKWTPSDITSLTPNQMEKRWGEKQLAGIFSFFSQNFALAEETATQYKRAGQSAVTYTKIEVTSPTENTIEIVANLTFDQSVLPGDIIKSVHPVISIFNADTRDLLQDLTPGPFSIGVDPNNVLTFRSSFERIKNDVPNIDLYFKGTFYLDFGNFTGTKYGRTSDYAWYIDPEGLKITGSNMPPPYTYDISLQDFPRPTAEAIMALIKEKPVRGSGIWKYYPGYGWQESLEDGRWDTINKKWVWTLRQDNYGVAAGELPKCEIPDSGWGAPSPDAAKNIKAYYTDPANGYNCPSSPKTKIDLFLCEDGKSSLCKTVADDIPNIGFYAWRVPNTSSGEYNIQIKNSNNVAVFQTGLFEIGSK